MTNKTKLSNLMLVIIDEVSMVGSNMLLEINKRLQQIKGVLPDVTFGGISILAVGDLYQLPPVGQPQLFNKVTDGYAQLYASGSLWVDEFEMIELDEIMRQRGDSTFSELLCRMRTSDYTPADIDVLGLKAIQTSPYRTTFNDAVPLTKHEVVFLAKGKKGSEITRLQFPLTLAWATTIHKVQGLTLDETVVDMKGGRFSAGQLMLPLKDYRVCTF